MGSIIGDNLYLYARYKDRIKDDEAVKLKKRIVILSDTHITERGVFNKEMFRKAVEEIIEIKDVDYIIHLGDLTHSGTYMEYQYAIECIKSLAKKKFYIIPGNHDAKNVGYLIFEELFGSRTFEIEDRDVYILGLDSSIPDQDTGRIGKRNIENIGKIFKDKQNKIKILCFHHQLIPIPLTGRERSAIIDGGDALEMILDADIDVVLNGHRHISNIYSCTNGNKEVVIFNSGTTSSNKTRYRELFSYTILDIIDKSVKFTTKKLMDGNEITRERYIRMAFNPIPSRINKKPFLKIVHIGNTHFSSENFSEEIYQEAVRQINKLNPDIVIHSGDITNTNKLSEFELASSKLQHIKAPKIIIPGESDLKSFGWSLFPKMIGPLDPFFENEKLRVVGINSIDMTISGGIIGRRKMRETISLLKEQNDKKINIVSFYHNIIPHPKTKFETMLSDAGTVLKSFTTPENRIHFILSGHDHVSFSLQIEDTILSSCGTLSSSDYLDLKGNTYNILSCFEDGLIEIEKVYVRSSIKEISGKYWINI